MAGAQDDWERRAAGDPRTPPQQLSELANRRWDLHAVIAANPNAFPELRRWIAQVHPAALPPVPPRPPQPMPVPASGRQGPIPPQAARPVPAPPQIPGYPRPVVSGVRERRGSAGWWFAGCGCLLVLALGVLGVVLFWAALAGQVGATNAAGEIAAQNGGAAAGGEAGDEPEVAEHLADFEAEQATYDALRTRLDGNPVAPLVAVYDEQMDVLEERAQDPEIDEFGARSLAYQAAQYREELEAAFAAADARKARQDGTLTERLVMRETDGFVDVVRDAETECGASEAGSITTGCVFGGDPLTIHLLPESGIDSDWEREMLVIHELAHVYQNADEEGLADDLVARGLFQKSREKMADCYALTYFDRWELAYGGQSIGYDYVCTESERQAIREWAAAIDAPMPN